MQGLGKSDRSSPHWWESPMNTTGKAARRQELQQGSKLVSWYFMKYFFFFFLKYFLIFLCLYILTPDRTHKKYMRSKWFPQMFYTWFGNRQCSRREEDYSSPQQPGQDSRQLQKHPSLHAAPPPRAQHPANNAPPAPKPTTAKAYLGD